MHEPQAQHLLGARQPLLASSGHLRPRGKQQDAGREFAKALLEKAAVLHVLARRGLGVADLQQQRNLQQRRERVVLVEVQLRLAHHGEQLGQHVARGFLPPFVRTRNLVQHGGEQGGCLGMAAGGDKASGVRHEMIPMARVIRRPEDRLPDRLLTGHRRAPGFAHEFLEREPGRGRGQPGVHRLDDGQQPAAGLVIHPGVAANVGHPAQRRVAAHVPREKNVRVAGLPRDQQRGLERVPIGGLEPLPCQPGGVLAVIGRDLLEAAAQKRPPAFGGLLAFQQVGDAFPGLTRAEVDECRLLPMRRRLGGKSHPA